MSPKPPTRKSGSSGAVWRGESAIAPAAWPQPAKPVSGLRTDAVACPGVQWLAISEPAASAVTMA